MTIRLISEELNERIVSIEGNRNDISTARSTLEEALISQFQRLVLGLCSSEALQGEVLDDNCLNSIKDYFYSECNEITNNQILENITTGVINKQWRIISLSELKDIEIRIFNKYVSLWNDIEINEQLSLLGSSLRFFFAGNDQLSLSHIKSMLGYKDESEYIDGRFILGNISHVSATYFGPLYYFITEKASSPYFQNSIPAFTIGDTTVIRDICLHGKSIDQILIHELLHGLSYSFKDNLPFGQANWKLWIKRDICRYLIYEDTFEEAKDEIGRYQEVANKIASVMKISKSDLYQKFMNLGFGDDFQSIFYELVEDGVIKKATNGMYYAIHLRKGAKWDIY